MALTEKEIIFIHNWFKGIGHKSYKRKVILKGIDWSDKKINAVWDRLEKEEKEKFMLTKNREMNLRKVV